MEFKKGILAGLIALGFFVLIMFLGGEPTLMELIILYGVVLLHFKR